jgi:hypothetical protein
MNTIGSTTLSPTLSSTLSTFDDREIPVPFNVLRMPRHPLPGHDLQIIGLAATPHGFRVHYRLDPVVRRGWAPWAEATDDAGNLWLFGGGGYGEVEEADPPYTDGVVTTGPARPQPGARYWITIGLYDDHELVLTAEPDVAVPW